MNSNRSGRQIPTPNPVDSFENLKRRVERLLRGSRYPYTPSNPAQALLSFNNPKDPYYASSDPTNSVASFLDFISLAVPDGEVYVFGGLLRDIAFYGAAGFSSDVDLVVTDGWIPYEAFSLKLGAKRNKFGGMRFYIGEMPVDLWKASETWAFQQGLVDYKGIASLLDTTILNWDAILLNWRTKRLLAKQEYLQELSERVLDVVLTKNPNPLGMLVRVMRHLALKDARSMSIRAAEYLGKACSEYSYEQLSDYEVRKNRFPVIEKSSYDFFRRYEQINGRSPRERQSLAETAVLRELGLEPNE